jgi:hypothetical protein
MFRSVLLAAPFVLAATFAQAVDAPPAMKAFVESDVMTWAHDANIISAIQAKNAETAGMSEAEIIELDNQWRAEVGTGSTPLIDAVMGTDLSAFLKQKVADSGGRITEIFVMDAKGLNVASSGVTSDYWQGDEAKFTETYPKGSGTIFVDKVEFDESSQSYAGQISVAITDPATGQVIGAMTVSLNAEAFF